MSKAINLTKDLLRALKAKDYPFLAVSAYVGIGDDLTAFPVVSLWNDAAEHTVFIAVAGRDDQLNAAHNYAMQEARDTERGGMCYAMSPTGWLDGQWAHGWDAEDDFGANMLDSEHV